MTRYKVTVPPTMEMGSYWAYVTDDCQTKEQDALQEYNSAREHDGLRPLKRMPNGTKYMRQLTERETKGGA